MNAFVLMFTIRCKFFNVVCPWNVVLLSCIGWERKRKKNSLKNRKINQNREKFFY